MSSPSWPQQLEASPHAAIDIGRRREIRSSPGRHGGEPGRARVEGAGGLEHVGEIVGEPFEIVVRVAGTTPRHAQDGPDIVRHCFRTVVSGLALCCPLPNTQHLRLGSVVRVRGSVTGQRTQGINDVTEISAESIERMG